MKCSIPNKITIINKNTKIHQERVHKISKYFHSIDKKNDKDNNNHRIQEMIQMVTLCSLQPKRIKNLCMM